MAKRSIFAAPAVWKHLRDRTRRLPVWFSLGRKAVTDDEMRVEKNGTHIDPVCKMLVSPETAAGEYEYKGEKYHFCSVGCKNKFANNPDSFLSVTESENTR